MTAHPSAVFFAIYPDWYPGNVPIEKARGTVEVWALGEDCFRITAPGHERIVVGFEETERAADALAEQLE